LTEEFNKRNLAVLYELIAPDVILYVHALQLIGLEEDKQFITGIIKGFPDYYDTIEDIIAEGDKVCVRATYTGTHTGEYRGLAPTGKKFTEPYVHIYRIVNGKVVECWVVIDELDFLKQLGVIEYTEKAKKLLPEVVT
jgi:predicted ester cyclase